MALILPSTTWGQGPTRALLLHGFTGAKESFGHLAARLGEALTATCVDLPGHGSAPLPQATGADGFLEVVEALAATLDAPQVVIGYSQGARLALALAVLHPEKVSRLVIESCNPGIRQRKERARRRMEDEQRAAFVRRHGVPAFIDQWERHPVLAGHAALSDEQRQALRARRLQHQANGLAGALECLGQGVQPDFSRRLSTMRVPTLVVSGKKDLRYTRIAARMAHDLPLAWRVAIDGAGHAPHLERPDAWAAEVGAFVGTGWTHEPRPSVGAHA